MDIFDYIKAEETRYESIPIEVTDGWDWGMRDHVVRSKLYLNSRYKDGDDGDLFFNITLAKKNLQKRATDIDVKDIILYSDSAKDQYKSFVATKFHQRWARMADMGTVFNEAGESYNSFGGALIKTVKSPEGNVPEVIDLETIAFCDQTDMLGGPICIRKYMTPAELLEMKDVWNDEAIDDAITFSKPMQKNTKHGLDNATPGQYVKVYDVHGVLAEAYLTGESEDEDKYTRQTHIVAEYNTEEGEKKGITLFEGHRKESPYDVLLRDPIKGRALGRGTVEELFQEQVWTNYSMEAQKDILDQASVMLFQTADQRFSDRNILRPTENGQVLVTEQNMPLTQVNNSPANVVAFEQNMALWTDNAKDKAGAFEAISGEAPKSGTPFSSLALQNEEAHSLHRQRMEEIGLFWRKYYSKRVLPDLQKHMNNTEEFNAVLTREEIERVDKARSEEMGEAVENEIVLNGGIVEPGMKEFAQDQVLKELEKTGDKRFFTLEKDFFKDVPIDVDVIITGEQRNNALVANKLSALFAQVAGNPQILQDPTMAALFNDILENSGVSPLSYGLTSQRRQQQPAPQQGEGQPSPVALGQQPAPQQPLA